MPSTAKILIVDHRPVIAEIYSRRLRDAGLDAAIASDKSAAFLALANPGADLMLLSADLPAGQSFEILAAIRQQAGFPSSSVPVLVVSSDGSGWDIEKAMYYGVQDLLVATEYSPAEIVAKIKKHLP